MHLRKACIERTECEWKNMELMGRKQRTKQKGENERKRINEREERRVLLFELE